MSSALAVKSIRLNDTHATVFDQRYEIVGTIWQSKNSVVYKAHPLGATASQALIALKVLHTETKHDQDHPSRMRREALALLCCRNDHVVKLIDYVSHPKMCYLAMEFAEGGDLREGLEHPNEYRLIEILIQVLTGLEAVHTAGVIHRDIKPENILLMQGGKVKLTDFSLALLPGESITTDEANSGVGTFDYLAPECLGAGQYSQVSDIYAVGVSAYKLMTGEVPWEHAPLAEQLSSKLVGSFPLNSKKLLGYSDNLIRIIGRALDPDPTERFQSATEFKTVLLSLLNPEIGQVAGDSILSRIKHSIQGMIRK
ncbi:serine/threonine protein kinase [bacterium]|nr:serine/threonine protein kinase [bacterium]